MKFFLLLVMLVKITNLFSQSSISYQVKLPGTSEETIIPKFLSGIYSNGSFVWSIEYLCYMNPDRSKDIAYAQRSYSFDNVDTSTYRIGDRYVMFQFVFYDSANNVIGDT